LRLMLLCMLATLTTLPAAAALPTPAGLAAGTPGVTPGTCRQGFGFRGVFLATTVVGPGRRYVCGLDDLLAFAFLFGSTPGTGRLVQCSGFPLLGFRCMQHLARTAEHLAQGGGFSFGCTPGTI